MFFCKGKSLLPICWMYEWFLARVMTYQILIFQCMFHCRYMDPCSIIMPQIGSDLYYWLHRIYCGMHSNFLSTLSVTFLVSLDMVYCVHDSGLCNGCFRQNYLAISTSAWEILSCKAIIMASLKPVEYFIYRSGDMIHL